MWDSVLIFYKLGYWVSVAADYTRFMNFFYLNSTRFMNLIGGKRLLIKQLKINLASEALSCNLIA